MPTNESPVHIDLVLVIEPSESYRVRTEEVTIWGDFEPGTLPMLFIPAIGDKYRIAGQNITITGRNQHGGKIVLEAKIHFNYQGRDADDAMSRYTMKKITDFVEAGFVSTWVD